MNMPKSALLALVLFNHGFFATGDEDFNFVPCSETSSVVSSWCDSSKIDVKCTIDIGRDVYLCECPNWPSSCPDECIMGDDATSNRVKTHDSILCQGIPQDEPNYILKNTGSDLPLHHCENNGAFANWCNEGTNPGLDCLLLPTLNEYVCTCMEHSSHCPEECIEGSTLGRKTKHAVRCLGIPADSPNYVLE